MKQSSDAIRMRQIFNLAYILFMEPENNDPNNLSKQ